MKSDEEEMNMIRSYDEPMYEADDVLQEIAYTRAREHIWYEMSMDTSVTGLTIYYEKECEELIDHRKWRDILDRIGMKHNEWMNRPRENPIFTQSDMNMMLIYSMGQSYACDVSYYEDKMYSYAKLFGNNIRKDLGDITLGIGEGIHSYLDTFYKKYDEWMQSLDGERYEFAKYIRDMVSRIQVPEEATTRTSLKPCPFCGKPAHIMEDMGTFRAVCDTEGCHGSDGWFFTQKDAIEAWNERSEE